MVPSSVAGHHCLRPAGKRCTVNLGAESTRPDTEPPINHTAEGYFFGEPRYVDQLFALWHLHQGEPVLHVHFLMV